MSVAGKIVLVTGATGGIGAAIARELAMQRAVLVLTGRSAPALEALAAELRGNGSNVSVVPADLGEPGAARELAEHVRTRSGPIEILVNCAGIQSFGFFCEESPEDTDRLFRINALAPMALINAVLPQMIQKRAGHLVNVGSIFG